MMDNNNSKYFDERDLGLEFVNCDAEWYIKSLNNAMADCKNFPCTTEFKSSYDEEVGIDENNADIPKGIKYRFHHFIINNCSMWMEPETDQTEFVDITHITNYNETCSVLIRRPDMVSPGFKRFLRDRIIFTLSFFNKSNFQAKDSRLLEDIKSYRDLMTLVCFCNKYRNTLSIGIGNTEDEISRFFLHKYVVMHTVDYRDESRKLIYKLELVSLDPFGNMPEFCNDRFNIDYDKKKLDYHVGENVQNAYGNMNHAKAATSCEAMYEPERALVPAKPEEERRKAMREELANYLDNLVGVPVVVPDETGSYDELLELKEVINKAHMALHNNKNLDTQWKNKDRFFSEAKVKALLSELSLPYIIKSEGTKDKRTITVTKVEM